MFKRYLTVLLVIASLAGSSIAGRGQAAQENVDLDAINKIKEEGLKRSQVMEILSYLTDVQGARLTNSPNIRAAQQWAKQKLTEWGLQNGNLEPWHFGRGWSLESFSAGLIKPYYVPLIAYPKAWSASTRGAVRGTPVLLDAKTPADLAQYKGKLKGAIVLFSPTRPVKAHFESLATRETDEGLLKMANAEPPAPAGGGRFNFTPEQRAERDFQNKKWELIYAEGAALVLEPSRGDGGTVFVQGATLSFPEGTPVVNRRNVRDKDAPPVIPQVVVGVEQYNRIVRMIVAKAPVEIEINISAKYHDQDLMSHNVVAEIPGTDLKDEVVMLGAHFDSWHAGTGATDNGAGSAVCMEAVRILQALGLKPRRTIRIGLWSGEEQGLLGSRAYVGEHFGKRLGNEPRFGDPQPPEQPNAPRPPVQLELKPDHAKFAGYFNLDNGTGKVRGVYMQGNELVRPIFRAWLAPFKDMGASTLTISNTGGTDHQSFDGVGLPGFQFIQDEIEYDSRTHHSNMDVFDRIQEDDMKQAAVIMAAFVYNTAMRAEKLPRKPLPGEVVHNGK